MPGLIDDAHAPAAEQRLNVIAWDPRQVGVRMLKRRGIRVGAMSRRREERIELPLDGDMRPQRRRTSVSSSG